jgi:hypothetical protein
MRLGVYLIPNQLINDTDAIGPAEPPPGPQFWGRMSDSKPPELGVWGPEVLQQIVDLYETHRYRLETLRHLAVLQIKLRIYVRSS